MNHSLEWTLDTRTQRVTHRSGLQLQIEGSLKDPSAISTLNIPKELSGLELVRLIRQGTEFCRQYKPPISNTRSNTRSNARKARESPPPERPQQTQPGRQVLRLNRNKQDS